MSFRSRKFHNFMEKCMIKNFLFRPTSANMLNHPFVQNIKNEGHVVESLKKHLTGIIKKRHKKGRICELPFNWNEYSDERGTYSCVGGLCPQTPPSATDDNKSTKT